MTENEKFEANDGLEAYFAAGRAADVLPSADLLGRIMADADMQMVQADAPAPRPPRQSLFASLMEAIGGWPSLAGMATAGVVGVWIGFSQPAGLDQVADQIWGVDNTSYLVDLAPDFAMAFDGDFEEG